MKHTLFLAAAIASAAFTANAAGLVTSWSGSVWSYEDQPNYNNDQSPDYLKIYAADGSDATLTASVGPGADAAAQLMDGIFYSHHTPVVLTGNISNVVSNLSQITFNIVASSLFASTANTFGLSFNGDSTVYAASDRLDPVPAAPIVTPVGTFNMTQFTVIWDIAGLDLSVPISSIQFVLPLGGFSAIADITVTQVPEPSTYALILGGLALGGVAIARRRRA